MKELILMIARALVDQPEKVSVSEVQGSQCTVFELKVEKSEIGKVIGKQGHTAQAIRTLLNAAAAKLKKRMVLEILETVESGSFPRVVRRNGAAFQKSKTGSQRPEFV